MIVCSFVRLLFSKKIKIVCNVKILVKLVKKDSINVYLALRIWKFPLFFLKIFVFWCALSKCMDIMELFCVHSVYLLVRLAKDKIIVKFYNFFFKLKNFVEKKVLIAWISICYIKIIVIQHVLLIR